MSAETASAFLQTEYEARGGPAAEERDEDSFEEALSHCLEDEEGALHFHLTDCVFSELRIALS